MSKTENQKKLLKILNEIFQLDQSDLDFGIYRIMNSKSKEINAFLDNELLSSVASAFSTNDNNAIQKELDEAIQQAQSLGADPETLPKVKELREKLATTTTSSNLENDLFSHLANFFKRYYKDGDFVSLRRYKKDTYAIPYEGEEVKLHWANSDQYYIKSGEYFRDYSFKVESKTIHFKLSDAQTESNNNKATSDKERRFIILETNPCEVIDDELYINFEYKAVGKGFKQDKLNEEAVTKALESIEDEAFINALNTLAPTEKNKKRTLFEKHVKSYTSRNSFDYFIHKDLGGFLSRELDFYIKNEMLFLDDIMNSPIKYEEVMSKIKIFKEVSSKIIAFLTQLEELQKRLWEKKKFVIETNYCMTLDKIDEKYHDEVFSNKEQLEEWEKLFGTAEKSDFLVVDTKFFSREFKYRLLSEFDNLDEVMDGVLINSENFGALNLLQNRYKEQVKTVYIDPPYNTGNDGFLYTDSFQHSSWMSFMFDRLAYAKELMSNDGILFSSIDDREFANLKYLTNSVFDSKNEISNLIWKKKKQPSFLSQVATVTEYVSVYAKKKELIKKLSIEKISDTTKRVDNATNGISERLIESGIECKSIDNGIIKKGIYKNKTMDTEILDDVYIKDGITQNSFTAKANFRNKQEDITKFCLEKLLFLTEKNSFRRYTSEEEKNKNKSIINLLLDWGDNQDSNNEMLNIFGDNSSFSYPKPTQLIYNLIKSTLYSEGVFLDYFAGSGTTGHAVINLNREDNGKRKYLLVEMGEYFDTVTKPRIQKVIYSDSWKDGKPTTKNGISQIFKYFKLESYEDTLNNLEFKKTKEQQATLDMYPQAKEDYILNYSLDVESQSSLLNIDTFSTPFDYKLKIATSSVGETKETNIDLVETFNYLLGLVVKRIELLKGYLVVEGQNLKKEKILIIWRDGQSSDELNEFFKKMDWSVYDREFDTIYVNGDNNLENLQKDEEHFKVKLIEQEFKRLMFGE